MSDQQHGSNIIETFPAFLQVALGCTCNLIIDIHDIVRSDINRYLPYLLTSLNSNKIRQL